MGNNIRPAARKPLLDSYAAAGGRDGRSPSPWIGFVFWPGSRLAEMMEEDARPCAGPDRRHGDRRGYRSGHHSEIGYHGGKVKVARPRVRDRAGKEVSLESWQALRGLSRPMVLNVSTRKYHRAVRLPEGDLAVGTSKSAVSLCGAGKKMKAWLASDLSNSTCPRSRSTVCMSAHVLMAAIGVDGNGDKHVLAVVEGATHGRSRP